ncbi:MAG: hypothetical protein JJU41_11210 [Bacteroidetes bacterium]|nr:hypothetical protein [Bacteroidota bacterium]MCH8524569.1 hypothetical protein [Balneolales bacterium]
MTNLNKLYRVLNLSPPPIVEDAFNMPVLWRHAVSFVIILNVLCTPYVLYLLFQMKKWRWVLFFVSLLVAAVAMNAGMVSILSLKGSLIIHFTVLALVLFMMFLRPKVNEWIELEMFELKIRQERLKRAGRNLR